MKFFDLVFKIRCNNLSGFVKFHYKTISVLYSKNTTTLDFYVSQISDVSALTLTHRADNTISEKPVSNSKYL